MEATVVQNRWIPKEHSPHPKQTDFLAYEGTEALYGGAGGGGKSNALLSAALQFADVPGYSAVILRRTYAQLSKSDAIMARSKEWLKGTDAHWSTETHTWTFPSGATLEFGHMDHEDAKYNFQGGAYNFCGFDELTQFSKTQYLYLFSRTRRLTESRINLRFRATANPGGVGHDWVKERFIPADFLNASQEEKFSKIWWKAGKRLFVPARLEDNPSLDVVSYDEMLQELDYVTRQQMRHGDWQAHADGRFKREWWRRYRRGEDHIVLDDGTICLLDRLAGRNEPNSVKVLGPVPRFIIIDPANRKTKASKFTAMGVFGDLGEQRLAVLDMLREQLAVDEIIPRLAWLCERWQPEWVGIEANGFQMFLVKEARRDRRIPTVRELEPEGKSKLTRATTSIIRAEHGLIYLPSDREAHPWLEQWETEHHSFTGDEKLDQYTDAVDTTAYAVLSMEYFERGGEPEVLARRAW